MNLPSNVSVLLHNRVTQAIVQKSARRVAGNSPRLNSIYLLCHCNHIIFPTHPGYSWVLALIYLAVEWKPKAHLCLELLLSNFTGTKKIRQDHSHRIDSPQRLPKVIGA